MILKVVEFPNSVVSDDNNEPAYDNIRKILK